MTRSKTRLNFFGRWFKNYELSCQFGAACAASPDATCLCFELGGCVEAAQRHRSLLEKSSGPSTEAAKTRGADEVGV